MTREDIIRMATEAGLKRGQHWNKSNMDIKHIERFVALFAAAEREKHEPLRHAIREAMYLLDQPEPRVHAAYGELHNAIRARGEK